MLVHSFSRENEWSGDYQQFLALFEVAGKVDAVVFAKTVNGVKLYFRWVIGDKRYLHK